MSQARTSPRETVDEGFPLAGTPREQLTFLANYSALAPSTFNSQPWKFRIAEGALEVHADLGRWLKSVDRDGREMVISCGAAFANAAVACHHFGYRPDINKTANGVLAEGSLARLRIGRTQDADAGNAWMFHAIRRRHTVRDAFKTKPISDGVMKEISDAMGVEGVEVGSVDDESRRLQLAGLSEKVFSQTGPDQERRAEVAKWRAAWPSLGGKGGARAARDSLGRAAESEGGGWASERGHFVRLMECPRILVLSSRGDEVSDWFDVGIALERALLWACSRGVQAAFVSSLTMAHSARVLTQEILGTRGLPQVVLCLGYTDSQPTSPRRALGEMLMGS
jgi:hypothetical protein